MKFDKKDFTRLVDFSWPGDHSALSTTLKKCHTVSLNIKQATQVEIRQRTALQEKQAVDKSSRRMARGFQQLLSTGLVVVFFFLVGQPPPSNRNAALNTLTHFPNRQTAPFCFFSRELDTVFFSKFSLFPVILKKRAV